MPKRAYVTGATGFVGGRLVRRLLDGGHEVTVLARSPRKLAHLGADRLRLVQGDVTDEGPIRNSIGGHEWVFHVAAWYEVGVLPDQEEAMRTTNVHGTANVLGAAWKAGAERIVYCSTVGALGSSGAPGRLADEAHPHDGEFQCLYVKTKYEAHKVARRFVQEGAPVVIALPGAIYGPGDASVIAKQIELIASGKLPAVVRAPVVYCYTYVDDVVSGLVLAAERGKIGEEYILAGPALSLAAFVAEVARAAGVKPPRRTVSPYVLRLAGWLADRVPAARALGSGLPVSGEAARMALDANWGFSSAKAKRDLGWEARSLDEGLASTLRAVTRGPA